MNPTNPAAQNLTVNAITTMLRVMSRQPMTISEELAASWTNAQPDKKSRRDAKGGHEFTRD